jgi:hypothetical protein
MIMRKNLYRLIVALTTFMVGIIAAFYFHQSANISHQVEVVETSEPKPFVIKLKPSIVCSDELLKQISGGLLNDEDFIDELTYDNLETFDCSENFRVKKIDLNGDRKPEFVVQGLDKYLCSPTGNCSFWIYRKTENGYEQILEASDVQQYNFGRTLNNGYLDLTTFMHGSAFDSDLSVYRFDGDMYRLKECGERSYSYLDKKGQFHIRKRPLITISKCSE